MAGLLVSVRGAAEAAAALAGGAALIDIKEPSLGSLGRASDQARAEVLDAVAGRVPVSAALGELRDGCEAGPHLARLAFVKWGLAGCGHLDWRASLRQARQVVEASGPCRLVVAAYADWRRAAAPTPADVCHFAIHERAAALLLDTCRKDGSTLLDWLSAAELGELVQWCRAGGLRVALAGALGARQIEALAPLRPDWFAVRGAVCPGSRRDGAVDPDRVRDLAELLRRSPGD